MNQRHTIILWKESDKEKREVEEIARESFDTMDILQRFDEDWRPNFLAGYTKTKKKFEWTYENYYNQFKKENHEHDQDVIGYRMYFFSAQEDEKCFGHSICTGNMHFTNTVVIKIASGLNIWEPAVAFKLTDLFQSLVKQFKPYWGCILNKVEGEAVKTYYDKDVKKPGTVYWLNYYNQDTVKSVGEDKIQAFLKEYPKTIFQDGILRVKDTPFNYENEADVKLHEEMVAKLL